VIGMNTTTRVLVAYATAAGSTTGVAERIAETLRRSGADVVCRPAGPDIDPDDFDAFVVGSAVHNMAWLAPALEFLRRVADRDRPVWCFSVGGVQPKGAVTRWMTDQELQKVAQAFPASLRPRAHTLFGGIIDMKGTPLWGRLFFRVTGGRPGDNRDWPAIEAWGGEVAHSLPTAGDAPAATSAGTGTPDLVVDRARQRTGKAPATRDQRT
jgi:menaquinone-dependent protoporphyrinogen oxidase